MGTFLLSELTPPTFLSPLCLQTHHNNVLEKKRILAKYQSQVEAMECENKNREAELLELWLAVQERKGIDKLAGKASGSF